MSVWELRQHLESQIPAWGLFAFVAVFCLSAAIYFFFVERIHPMICQARKNRYLKRKITELKSDLGYLEQKSHLTEETKAKVRLRIHRQIRKLSEMIIE